MITKSGDAAFWGFLAFYGLCVAVTYVVYLRPVPATAPTPRLAYAGV
jgi:NNP family nitrate/nitrite transporter-like MFS transporter